MQDLLPVQHTSLLVIACTLRTVRILHLTPLIQFDPENGDYCHGNRGSQ